MKEYIDIVFNIKKARKINLKTKFSTCFLDTPAYCFGHCFPVKFLIRQL
jgi:hypothetical protein